MSERLSKQQRVFRARGPIARTDQLTIIDVCYGFHNGEILTMVSNQGTLINAEFSDKWHGLNTELQILIRSLHMALALPRARQIHFLEEQQGELLKLYAEFAGLLDRYMRDGYHWPVIEVLKAQVIHYEEAIQEAIKGDLQPLEALSQAKDSMAVSLRELIAIRDRGQRESDEKTRILGQYTDTFHAPGQSWVVTGRKVLDVLKQLTALPDGDKYSWLTHTIDELSEAVQRGDTEAIRGLLKHPMLQWRKENPQ